ncbi:MAG: hypothetical protein NZ874_07990 [Fimbriimonadales bacterium]|nr:hypothetical protein [Fimbriimonadales bacterium]
MRWGWVLVLTLLGSVQGAPQTVLRVRPLLDDEAMLYRTPLMVDIERRGSPTRGQLIVRDPSIGAYVYPLDLAAGTRKRIAVRISATTRPSLRRWQPVQQLEWRSEDGERIVHELPLPLRTHLPVVVVGNFIGGLESLNQQKVAFNSEEKSWRNRELPLRVYYRRPSELPDTLSPLLELPVVLLVDGAELLTEAQWRALQQWLVAGGTLMVSAGSLGPAVRQLPFAQWLPPLQFASGAPSVAQMPHGAPGWHPLASSGVARPLWYRRRVGMGNLYLFLGDLGRAEWRAQARLASVLKTELAPRAGFPTERLISRWLDALMQGMLENTRLTQIGVGTAVLVGYLVLVGASVIYLRRRRKIASVFVPVATLAALASAAILIFPPRLHTLEPMVFTRLLSETSTVEVGYCQAMLGVGQHSIKLPEEAELLGFMAQPSATVRVIYAESAPEVAIQCSGLTRVSLCFIRPEDGAPRLEIEPLADGLRLRNRSSHTLWGVQMLQRASPESAPRTLWQMTRLNAGQAVQAKVSIDPDAWYTVVYATYRRQGAPSVRLNGTPVWEVNTIYAFVP